MIDHRPMTGISGLESDRRVSSSIGDIYIYIYVYIYIYIHTYTSLIVIYIYRIIYTSWVCSVCLYADVEICVCIDCIIQFMHCMGPFGHCI